MFWNRKKGSDQKALEKRLPSFEEAKEAARRAVFLNIAGKMSSDPTLKQGMAELFQLCRTVAIAAGAAEGISEADIDKDLSRLCDDDVARLKGAPEDEFIRFARESRDLVNKFLAALN